MVAAATRVNPPGRQRSYEGRMTWRSPDQAQRVRVAPPIRVQSRSPDGAKRNPGWLSDAARFVLRPSRLQHVASPAVFGQKSANFRIVRRTKRLMLLG